MLFRSALKTLDHVHTALRRVALSTDARMEFYTLIARDPGPTALDVIFSGHVNDLKRVQFFDISIGELQKRSRFSVRVQPEAVARQTVRGFLTDLSVRPLPQLLTRYAAASKRFGELLPKFLELGVNLQGKEKQLLSETWPVAQTKANEAVVQVPLAPMGTPGALLLSGASHFFLSKIPLWSSGTLLFCRSRSGDHFFLPPEKSPPSPSFCPWF